MAASRMNRMRPYFIDLIEFPFKHKKAVIPDGITAFWVRRKGLVYIFSPLGEKIMVLPPSRPAASNSPPDYCI